MAETNDAAAADPSGTGPCPAPAAGAWAAQDFDEALYLSLNPDVASAVRMGHIGSGLAHWIAYGRADELAGHRPSLLHDQHYRALPDQKSTPPTPQEIAAFDPESYLEANGDVRLAIGSDPSAALTHWIEHGRYEGRLSSNRKTYLGRVKHPARVAAKPFGVNFYAPFAARSGLGTAARGYLAALRKAGIPVHLVNIDVSSGQYRVAAREYDIPGPYRVNVLQVNADAMDRFYNLFRHGRFDNAYNIAIWAWELNILRPDWFSTFAAVDEVWTLSTFNTGAVAPMAPVPVRTMNCVVLPAPPTPFDRQYFSLPPGFLFLTVFDVGSSIARKNPHAVVAAFQAAFAGRDDVHLVLKFHAAHSDPAALREFLRSVHGVPNVIIRAKTLTEAEMHGLQACCDCLVSPHRSEGFGLNIAEFMQLGKPVVVTGYSGNMDFTDAENSFLVPYRMSQLVEQSGPYLPGYQWAEPDEQMLTSLMGTVCDDPTEAARRGARAADAIRTKLSADVVGARIQARLTELGLADTLPPYVGLLAREIRQAPPVPDAVTVMVTRAAAAARPTISVIVPVYNVPPEYLEKCIASVLAQTYQRWELCLCNDASTRAETVAVLGRYQGTDPRIRIVHLARNAGISDASNAAVGQATGSYLLMLDNDDELTPDALQHIAEAVIQDPTIDALYSDEDKYDVQGRLCDHYFKPDWSPEHLESVMYTLHPLTVRTSLFLELGGFRREFSGAQDWDLMLRISRATQAIHHVPRILYHWRMIPGSASAEVDAKPEALDAGMRALQDHVDAKYGGAAAVEPAGLQGYYRVRHAVVNQPPVTLLITTNNTKLTLPDRKPFVMVENLVASIEAHTDYANRRIVVVDNGNTPPKVRAAYKRAGIELHSYAGSMDPFNFADKANFAFRQVRTEHVVLMNDDMEAFEDDWLRALLEYSQRPDVGGCGGKLLHADGTIQHVGTVLGVNGGAAHVYHGFPGDYVGYNGYTHVVRNYSALTGAGFATRMEVINELGGLDPMFAIDFNDIDLCLRMRRHGYRLVYTPHSRMYHFESKTAVRTAQAPAEVKLFNDRWRGVITNDPFYNPNLSRTRHDFAGA